MFSFTKLQSQTLLLDCNTAKKKNISVKTGINFIPIPNDDCVFNLWGKRFSFPKKHTEHYLPMGLHTFNASVFLQDVDAYLVSSGTDMSLKTMFQDFQNLNYSMQVERSGLELLNDHLTALKYDEYLSMLNPADISLNQISNPRNFLKVLFWLTIVLIIFGTLLYCLCGISPCSLCLKACDVCTTIGVKIKYRNATPPPPPVEMDIYNPHDVSFEPFIADAAHWIIGNSHCLFKHPRTGRMYEYNVFDKTLCRGDIIVARNVALPRFCNQLFEETQSQNKIYPNPAD